MALSVWNVLLCKFNDQPTEPHPREFYESLFTDTGNGKNNVVDFFYAMSHGKVDIGKSKVFGWISLDHSSTEVTPWNRGNIIQWARDSAANNSITLSSSEGLVIILNVASQTFAYLGTPVCVLDDAGWFPSISGQEMGHGYGLDHSRLEGSSQDYSDAWDVMSTWNSCFCVTHSEYVKIGPGLNAANMNSIGWIDNTRVWKNGQREVDAVIELRPLHQHNLSGYLAAFFNDHYWIEFRVKEKWDKEIPRPAILVHYFFAGKSYLVKDSNGDRDGTKGSIYFLNRDPLPSIWKTPPVQQVEVLDIDPAKKIAQLRIQSRKGKIWSPVNISKGAKNVSKGVMRDGGGWIIMGKKIIRIPPRTPLYDLLGAISKTLEADRSKNVKSNRSVRMKGYKKIVKIAEEELEHLHISGGISSPDE